MGVFVGLNHSQEILAKYGEPLHAELEQLTAGITTALRDVVANRSSDLTVALKAEIAAAASSGEPIDIDTDEYNLASSTTETSVYSHVIPANTLAAGKYLYAVVDGMAQNQAGTTDALNVKIVFGSTTLATGQIGSAYSNDGASSFRPFRIETLISCVAAADQRAIMRVLFNDSATGDIAAAGWSTGLYSDRYAFHNTIAEGLGSDLTFNVLLKHAFSGATTTFKKHLGFIEVH